jgi:beta-galactosidase
MFPFGADYYPEQWPLERWPEDARLMKEAGFNVVRLAEFAWSRLEPGEGRFDFTWLDRALEILHAQGIAALLGTPTASPPPWLMSAHPEIFRLGEDGRRATFGNRREYCPSHPVYAEHSRRIVSTMAAHYAAHPAVIGWQIDNEFGDRCFCPLCQARFQDWLRERYGSLDALNASWGTDFWSHVYTDWQLIPVPLASGGSPNPGLALDFRRFVSDTYAAYQKMQMDLIRAACPGHFITHNFMGFGYEGLDYFDLARDLDLVSWDNYPSGFWLKDRLALEPDALGLGHDAMRGLKKMNFWVMEQQAGPSGWETISPAPRPGDLRRWAYQSIAHGADGIVFFRWRTARYGTEQYWHGLLDHHGRPGRRYEEIKRMGAELTRIGDGIRKAQVKAKVAILQSYDSRFAFQIQPNNPRFRYGEHVLNIYQAFFHLNIPVDVIAPQADLSGYGLVIAPALYVLPEATAAALARYVQAGGTLVVTPRTGVKDEANAVVNQPLPGLLAEVCGLTVAEYDSLSEDAPQSIRFLLPELKALGSFEERTWCDLLAPAGARVLAEYASDYYAGRPAITLNQHGSGQAVYVGVFGDRALYRALLGWLVQSLNIPPVMDAPEGIEVAERWQGDRRLLFILNHTCASGKVSLPGGYINLLDGKVLRGKLTIPGRDLVILASQPEGQDHE